MNTDLLEKHLQLVIEANRTTNITRIDSIEQGRILHIEDSLAGLDLLNSAPHGRYGDMGSGAGYPGIPLAIESGRKTVLIETVGKKATLLQGFIERLELQDTVTVYNGRIETLALERHSSFAALTARALSKVSCLLELASPLLMKDGILICYKANPDKEEMDHAQELEAKLGFTQIHESHFMLSDEISPRCLIAYKKTHKSSIKLPRKPGYAQKKPL